MDNNSIIINKIKYDFLASVEGHWRKLALCRSLHLMSGSFTVEYPFIACFCFILNFFVFCSVSLLLFKLYQTLQWSNEKKKTKGQTTIYKTLHRKLKIEQKCITNDKVQKTPKEVPHNTCWCLVDHTLCTILGETRRMSSHSKKKRTIARKICSSSVLPFLIVPSVFFNACVIKQDK